MHGESGRIDAALRPRLGVAEIVLLVLALGVRIAWALTAGTELYFDHVFNDATAWSLAQGHGFTTSLEPPYDPAIFRTPGYPAFMALVYAVAGHSVRAALVANALLDTASCWLLWRLVWNRLGAPGALGALLLAATYPFTIYAVGLPSPESLLVFLCLVLVALVERWPASGGWGRVVATGLVAAALAWIKPVFLPLPLFLLFADRLRGRDLRTAFARAVAVGAIAAVLFAPWVARNYSAFGRPVLAGEMGLVVWHGTHDFDPHRDQMIKENFEVAAAEGDDRYETTRRQYDDSHEFLRQDRRFLERGLDNMRARPVHALFLDPLRRVPRLWISMSYTGGAAWIGWGAAVACISYLLLGAYGLRSLRDPYGLRELAAWWVVPVLLTAVYAVFHVEARYTIPARSTLLFLGGAALQPVMLRVRMRLSPGIDAETGPRQPNE